MQKNSFGKRILNKLTGSRETSLLIVLILLCLFIQSRNGSFLTPATITDMLKNYSTTMILSVGMMCVLLIAGIDISIGSTLAFAGMCSALLLRDGAYTSTLVGFLISIAIGIACGLLIGLIIVKGKVYPIIATLGFMNIFRGATYLIANNQWVSAYQIPDSFKEFAQSSSLSFGLINNLILIMIVCYVIFFIVMKWTRIGRRIYAVGSNPEAARISGIRIELIQIMVYTIMGCLAGLAGAMWVSVYGSAQGDMATGIEMDAIAACVLGGVSLNGGQGSVLGALLGALTIAIIDKALPLIGVSQFWQTAIKGFIILVAIIVNVLTQRMMKKNVLARREI